jgi:hypothetical protein
VEGKDRDKGREKPKTEPKTNKQTRREEEMNGLVLRLFGIGKIFTKLRNGIAGWRNEVEGWKFEFLSGFLQRL